MIDSINGKIAVAPSGKPSKFRFAAFEVDLAAGELRKNGIRLRLQEQPLQLLAALLEKPGELVTREELIRRLWHDGTTVDFDRGLNAAVARLRQALSDSADAPRFVETVARRGYRLLASVESVGEPDSPPAAPAPLPGRSRRFWAAASVVAIMTITSGVLLFRIGGNPPAQQLSATPLTTEPGFEGHPSLSPDGSHVAFEWDRGGSDRHIYIKVTGEGDPVRLTSSEHPEFGPAWSRDGRHIAFLRVQRSTETGGAANVALFVIPALGGVERKIAEFVTPFWSERNRLRRLDWAPGHRHVLGSGAQRAGESERLFLADIDTAAITWLTDARPSDLDGDREPAISPDGRTLAFTRGRLTVDESLYLLPLTPDLRPAGSPRPIAAGRVARSPSWTPEGREIVFSFGGRIVRVHAAGGAPREVPGVGPGGTPALSASGHFAFAKTISDSNIWRLDLRHADRGGSAQTLLIASTTSDQDARYSPDGKRIALQSTRSGFPEIWTCGSDGTGCVQVTRFKTPYITGTPRWSPGGKRIAFDSAAEGAFNVYVVDENGASLRRLTSGAGNHVIPSWSRDGKSVYFASHRAGRFEIWKVPSDGSGAAVQVTHAGGLTAFESEDGQALYYTKSDSDPRLFRAALDGSGETEVLSGVANRGFVTASDRIYYLRSEAPGQFTVRQFLLSTREDSEIARISKPMYLGLSLSPDGRYLIYSQIDQEGSDLMMVAGFR